MAISSVVTDLKEIIGDIIESNLDQFEESGELMVETSYGNSTYQLDEIDESEDLCLQGLVHHIMHEEGLYEKFLNTVQLNYMKYMIEESPYYIYYPEPESNEGSHEEVMEDIRAKEIIEEIHHRMIIFVARVLMDQGFDVPVLEEYLAESEEDEEAV